jgi:phosphatidylglycerol lysyltransferase
MKRQIQNYAAAVLGLVLFGIALFIIHTKLGKYRYHDIAEQLSLLPMHHLLGALILSVLDYLVLTAYDWLALRYIKHPIKYVHTALASFLGYAFSHNMTFIGGSAVRFRIYSTFGVSAANVATLVAFCATTFWLGFFTVGAAVFLFSPERLPAAMNLPFVTVRPIGAIFLIIVTAYITLSIVKRAPVRIHKWQFEVPSPDLVWKQILASSVDWILAGSVLYMLLPDIPDTAGGNLGLLGFMPIFLLAQVAGLLSYVPGGLGVFETAILMLLSPFYESSVIISSLLVYRVVYYWVPFGFASLLLAGLEFLFTRQTITRIASGFGKVLTTVMPNVLAVTTFVSGVVLLVSGALPESKGRLEWLRDLLPVPAIEFSHFLGSLIGAILLILARAIQRKVNAAYYLAVALLSAGIVFSLLKGLAYEEAIILLVMLLVLLPCRTSFYRKSPVFAGRLTSAWILLTIVAVLCSIWLGIFTYKHIEYRNELWWQFAIHDNAPRFYRASAAAISVLLIFAVIKMLRGSVYPRETTFETSADDVSRIVSQSNRTVSQLALLGDKRFIFNDDKTAFIMFAVEGRSWVAMGEPVGSEDTWDDLLWRFRELCDEFDAWPVFYQIDQDNLPLYLQFGLKFLKLGEEAKVDLQTFSLEGGQRKGIRYSHNKLSNEGYTFEIITADKIDAQMGTLREISDSWLKSKHTREKQFSLGYFEPAYIRRTPAAVIRLKGRIVAFANVLQGADKEELSVDLMRHLPTAEGGIMDYLFAELMFWGQKEGFKWFNLGMAPLSGLQGGALSPLLERTGAFLFRYGEHFYNFQGLRHYKEKFNPVWEAKYLAAPGGFALPRVLTNVASLISGGPAGVVKK